MSDADGMTRESLAQAALYAQLADAAVASEDLPAVWRNKGLDHGLAEVGRAGARVLGWMNVVDADPRPLSEMLGDSDEGDLEFEAHARIEVLVSALDDTKREVSFSRMLKALGDALRADRTLGGACDHLSITSLRRTNLAMDGMAQIKAAEISVAMLLTAEDLLD